MIAADDVHVAVAEVHARFRYRADERDEWRFPEPDRDGIRWGDCEDFVLEVLRHAYGSREAAEQALMSGEARVWFCRLRGGTGHAVGEVMTEDAGAIRFDQTAEGRAAPTAEYMKRTWWTDWRKFTRWRIARKLWPNESRWETAQRLWPNATSVALLLAVLAGGAALAAVLVAAWDALLGALPL